MEGTIVVAAKSENCYRRRVYNSDK